MERFRLIESMRHLALPFCTSGVFLLSVAPEFKQS